MKIFRKNNGITLVALVVTIIVLLILAAVSLSLISGGNGVLNKASKAVTETDIAAGKEQTELLVAGYVADYYQEKYVDKTATGTAFEYVKGKFDESVNARK